MKGIVVEINNRDAVVLTDEGLFMKVRNREYAAGQTVNISKNVNFAAKWISRAAGIAAALALCTTGAFAYYTPTDYVSMDVNPSVEYSVNMFDRILDVKAVNDDGKKILAGLDMNNMTIDDAIKTTLDQFIKDGYLKTGGPDGDVVIATSNDEHSKAERMAKDLKKEVRTYLSSKNVTVAAIDAEAVRPERVKEAKELGVTPGKLNLVERLQKSTAGAISTQEWLNKPVKEISQAIKENRRERSAAFGNQSGKSAPAGSGSGWNQSGAFRQGRTHNGGYGSQDGRSFTTSGGMKQSGGQGLKNSVINGGQDRRQSGSQWKDRINIWQNGQSATGGWKDDQGQTSYRQNDQNRINGRPTDQNENGANGSGRNSRPASAGGVTLNDGDKSDGNEKNHRNGDRTKDE